MFSLCVQGFDVAEGGGILLISDVIRSTLGVPCAVLMGANIANEVAREQYCEATIGGENMHARILRTHTHTLKIYTKNIYTH